jgi:DNA-binding FrmR family transcriptional regulator
MPAALTADALARLRRIEGQVAGIARMIESGRECRDVVTQISAASKGLEQIGFRLLASGMRFCVEDESGAAEAGYSIEELERLFLKLA